MNKKYSEFLTEKGRIVGSILGHIAGKKLGGLAGSKLGSEAGELVGLASKSAVSTFWKNRAEGKNIRKLDKDIKKEMNKEQAERKDIEKKMKRTDDPKARLKLRTNLIMSRKKHDNMLNATRLKQEREKAKLLG